MTRRPSVRPLSRFRRAAGAVLAVALWFGAGSGPTRANEVVMPVQPDGALQPAAQDRADDAPPPDIGALAAALVDAATRRAVLEARPAGADGPMRVALRPDVTIERPLLHLGDVFAGLPGEIAAVPVGHAPEPGARIVLNADYLEGLATDYGVDWRPASRFVQAVVSRRGYDVGRTQVLDALRDRLLEAGMPPEAEVEITVMNVRATVGSPEDARVDVRDLYYDDRTGRFNALLQVPAEGPRARPVRLTGSVHVSIEVPVLVRPIRRGMVIQAEDVRWDTLRRSDLRPDILTDPADLVGQAARHGIQAGRPVRANQVALPELVRRNGLVTMVLETPFMTVTARGRALEGGAKGETVRIANVASDKEVLAVVTGRDTVRVSMGMMAVANR
jgi:flagella basal body P-ring formation protein FlgA